MDRKWGVIAAVVSAAAAVIALGPAFFSSCRGTTPSTETEAKGEGTAVGTGNVVVEGDVRGDGVAVGNNNTVYVHKDRDSAEAPKKAPAAE